MSNILNLGKDLYIKGRIGWKGLKKEEYLDSGDFKIINATALEDGYIDWDNCGFITKERYEESPEIMLQEDDILSSKDGTLGKSGYVKNMKTPCSVASGIFVLRNSSKEKVNFDYLYHLLTSHIFKDFIKRNKAEGSTINHLYQRDLENFEINLPDLEIQEKVAFLLNSIDRKIQNNNKQIQTLESLAKTIYDYWFVQFDFPNEDGKPYKSSGGKMVWNEELKREIPEGWKVKSISEFDCYTSDFTANGSFAGLAENVIYNNTKDYARLIRIVDVSNDFVPEKSIYIDKKGYDYLKSCQLFGGEIIICNVGNAGFIFRCPFLNEKMVLGPNGIVLKKEDFENFLYMYFSDQIGQHQIRTISSGSIQLKFNKTNFRKLKLFLPTIHVNSKFNLIFKNIK